MKLGYSPFNSPSFTPLGPFGDIYDEAVNLYHMDKVPDDLDAVVLWGGADISPSLYNEEPFHNSGPTLPSNRDLFEWEIMRQCVAKGIPMIGVCRGAQLMCAFAGGKLVQDVDQHGTNHWIKTHDGHDLFVTSAHHQMMYPYEVEHELLAWSAPARAVRYSPSNWYATKLLKREVAEPEVVYFPKIKALGAQCHPEWHHDRQGQAFNNWFNNLIKEKFHANHQQTC